MAGPIYLNCWAFYKNPSHVMIARVTSSACHEWSISLCLPSTFWPSLQKSDSGPTESLHAMPTVPTPRYIYKRSTGRPVLSESYLYACIIHKDNNYYQQPRVLLCRVY